MSKYFDQTARFREVELPVAEEKPTVVQRHLEPVPVQKAPVAEAETAPLDKCRRLELSMADILQSQFKGSESLEPVRESYRALRTRLLKLRSAQGLRSIVITSSIQGEGKTLTSLNLAMCCAQLHDMRVLLVDADIRSHGLTRVIGSPSGPGLSEVLENSCKPENAILATDLPNLHVLTGGIPSIPPAELLASRRFQEFVAWSSETFKLVILDSPPILNLADVELITGACDAALMVVRAQKTRRDVLSKSASQIDPKKLLGVVYNAAEGAHHHYKYAHPAAGEK